MFFSFNGVDSVSHGDRLRILREVFRVVKKGGYFSFSSHNTKSDEYKRFRTLLGSLRYRPFNLFKKLKGVSRYLRNRRHEVHTSEYSIINEPIEDYAYMLYYVSIPCAKQQLHDVGFDGHIRTYDRDGREASDNSTSAWIYYLTTK